MERFSNIFWLNKEVKEAIRWQFQLKKILMVSKD